MKRRRTIYFYFFLFASLREASFLFCVICVICGLNFSPFPQPLNSLPNARLQAVWQRAGDLYNGPHVKNISTSARVLLLPRLCLGMEIKRPCLHLVAEPLRLHYEAKPRNEKKQGKSLKIIPVWKYLWDLWQLWEEGQDYILDTSCRKIPK